MQRLRVGLVLLVLLAGCWGRPPAAEAPEPPALPEVPPLQIDHDHRDPALHDEVAGFQFRGFFEAATVLGEERARLADLQFYGNYTAVALNGRAGSSAGGFLLLEHLGGGNFSVLGRYRSGSEDNWYVKFSPDGRYVFLTANGAASPAALVNGTLESARSASLSGGARGIHIVSIQNPRAPALQGFYPAPVRVVNLAVWEGQQGRTYVAASLVQDRLGAATPAGETKDLNYVSILQFSPDPRAPRLEEVARWSPRDAAGIANAFPHDLSVWIYPANGRPLLYVAYWDAGAYIVDVTQPTQPSQVARIAPASSQDHVHTFKPHPLLIDGKYYAVVAPETFTGEPAGPFRLFDLTDARNPRAVASWSPPPAPRNTEPLLFSPHEFTLAEGRLFASNFHGGAWQLRLPDLVPEARWAKSLGDPARTQDWAVDITTVVYHRNLLFALDMNAGVVALQPYRDLPPGPFI